MIPDDVELIRNIKHQHEKQWLAINGVVAVGIGKTSSGRTGLIVSVSGDPERIRKQIPLSIEEISVEIQCVGELKAF